MAHRQIDDRASRGAPGPTAASAGAPADGQRPAVPRRRRRLVVGLLAALMAAVVAAVLFAVVRQEPAPAEPLAEGTAEWLSGASGDGAVGGAFGAWRGREIDLVGTWVDNSYSMTALAPLQPGADLDGWDESLDIAIGAFDEGESWEEAATGAYDDRWRESLTGMRDLWGSRPGTLYIRFAHEMNGNWYPWKVTADDADAFVTSWKRFRELQQEVFPAAQLVFCVNRESVETGVDWRETFPGSQYVDVMGVDYYNQYPYVGSAEDWEKSLTATTEGGAPKGLQAHLDFARSVGLPLAIPEWSGNADEGDSPAFVQGMHQFLSNNGGTDAGQVLYEILFNIDKDDKRWLLYGDGVRMPESAETYRRLWGRSAG